MRLMGNMNIENNELYMGGVSTVSLVEKYGTPLNVIDEEQVRDKCRRYAKNFRIDEGNRVAYAGKAFLSLHMCKIIKEENLYLDVVSGGELFTAYKSGFPLHRVYFHGNNKTLDEIEMGIELGVGVFVVDNFYELDLINEVAKKKGRIQRIIIRVTPGIEAHTHDYIKTGQIDSKFGFTMLEDNVLKVVNKAIKYDNIHFAGIHCHIGSQIFDIKPYEDAVDTMFDIANKIKHSTGVSIEEIDLGGGFGVYYTEGDEPKPIDKFCEHILEKAESKSRELNIKMPIMTIEPGRSIIGNAGVTLYTVGSIKNIPNVRKYVSVDGGMSDNIRPALYNAQYEGVLANKADFTEKELVTVCGKCCESGDILLKDIMLPNVESGDILAIMSTGAYGYSMANNYNKLLKPAVVTVNSGIDQLICKRETYEDIIKNEIL